jgi:hypothetical protein
MDVNQFLHAMPEVAQEEITRNGVNAVSIGDGINRLAIAGHNQGVAFYFKVDQVYNPEKSEKAGYEVFDPMEQVYHIIDRKNIIPMPVSMSPRELLAFNRDGECVGGKYKDSYLNWKHGRKQPGLALRKWEVISDSEVASLEAEGIFTVEQFAEYPRDRITSRYPQSFIVAHTRAQQWIAGKEIREKAGEQAVQVKALEDQNKDLVERLAKLEALLAAKETKVENKLTGGNRR